MRKKLVPILPTIVILAVLPAIQGCFTSVGFCCGRLSDTDETTRADRREVKKEQREEAEEAREEKAEAFLDRAAELRDRDLESYLRHVARELDLAKVWADMRAQPGFTRAIRVTALDAALDAPAAKGLPPGSALLRARVQEFPDWAVLVDAACKRAFTGELSAARRGGLARDLWLAERVSIRHLDAGLAGVEVAFETERGQLGGARTDPSGLAVYSSRIPLPAGSHVLRARLPAPPAGRTVESDSAWLSVRPPAAKVLAIHAPEGVLEWSPRSRATTHLEAAWRPRDACAAGALRDLMAGGMHVVLVSAEPDAMAPAIREGLRAARIAESPWANGRITLRFHEGRDAAAEPSAIAIRLSAALAPLPGDAHAIVGLVGLDPAIEAQAAAAAGVPFHRLARAADGGWCAGIPGILPPRVP